jgi:hypothetical protein
VIRGGTEYYSGGITMVDKEYDERLGAALRPIIGDNRGLPFGLEVSDRTAEMLANAFYINKLGLPPADKEMTAYETAERIKEFVRSSLPLFEPMEHEYNGVICEDTFEDLMRVGAFGPAQDMPERLRGREVIFKFESPIHDAIERQNAVTFLETKNLIAQAAEIDQSTIYELDARKALRAALKGIGSPAEWRRDEDEVDAMIAKEKAAQEEAQQAAMIQQQAEAGEQVGKAAEALGA